MKNKVTSIRLSEQNIKHLEIIKKEALQFWNEENIPTSKAIKFAITYTAMKLSEESDNNKTTQIW